MPPLKPDRFCFFYALLEPRILAAPEPEERVGDALRFTRFGDRPSLLHKMADANKYPQRQSSRLATRVSSRLVGRPQNLELHAFCFCRRLGLRFLVEYLRHSLLRAYQRNQRLSVFGI